MIFIVVVFNKQPPLIGNLGILEQVANAGKLYFVPLTLMGE